MKLADGLPLEVLDLFRDETKENVDGIVRGLGLLEHATPDDARPLVHDVARRLHTIKGGAAGIGFEPIARVAHEAENVLVAGAADRVRKVTRAIAWIVEALRDAAGADDADAILAELRGQTVATPATSKPTPPRVEVHDLPRMDAAARPVTSTSLPRANPGSGVFPTMVGAAVTDGPTRHGATPAASGRESVRVRAKTVEGLVAPLSALAGERTESRFRGERLRRVADAARSLLRKATVAPLGPGELQEFEALVALVEREASSARGSARAMSRAVASAEELLQSMRMVSVGSLEEPLRLAAMDAAARTGKDVQFALVGGGVLADRRVLDELRAPLLHLVRNAVDHGLETAEERAAAGKSGPARLEVRVVSLGEVIEVTVEDDGRGVDRAKVSESAVAKGLLGVDAAVALSDADLLGLLSAPGFTTRAQVTDLSGRGVGMDVVARVVRGLGGTLAMKTEAGRGTTFNLALPVSALSTRVLFVRLGDETLALPLSGVEVTARLGKDAFFDIGGRRFVSVGGSSVAVHELDQRRAEPDAEGKVTAVRVRADGTPLALLVDEILGEEEVSVRPLGPPVRRVSGVIGSTLAESGEVVVVLDPRALGRIGAFDTRHEKAPPRAARVLVVDDSITTRTLERHILERAGYQVDLARDGLEALAALRTKAYDVVVSDYEMPNLDGIGLVRAMRAEEALMSVPLILVTSVSAEETRRRALAAGANAYVVKGQFDQDTLLAAIRANLGEGLA